MLVFQARPLSLSHSSSVHSTFFTLFLSIFMFFNIYIKNSSKWISRRNFFEYAYDTRKIDYLNVIESFIFLLPTALSQCSASELMRQRKYLVCADWRDVHCANKQFPSPPCPPFSLSLSLFPYLNLQVSKQLKRGMSRKMLEMIALQKLWCCSAVFNIHPSNTPDIMLWLW